MHGCGQFSFKASMNSVKSHNSLAAKASLHVRQEGGHLTPSNYLCHEWEIIDGLASMTELTIKMLRRLRRRGKEANRQCGIGFSRFVLSRGRHGVAKACMQSAVDFPARRTL